MKKILLVAVMLCMSHSAFAEIIAMEVVPTAWKLENYVGNNVVVWYSGTTCNNGLLQFTDQATIDDKNRFWATIMSAKVSGKKVFVRYDNTNSCKINSFGMHN